jgi:small subunit ribosomal protein S6
LTDYEVLLMLDPELAEERQAEIVARVRERVEADGGTWDAQQPWGRRRLAYEIDHKHDAHYHLLTFAAEAETLDEVSRVLKITDGVMRHLAVRRVSAGRTPVPPPTPTMEAAPASDRPREYAGRSNRRSTEEDVVEEEEE